MDTDNNSYEAPADEHPVFIPPEDIRAIERVIHNLDRAQKAFLKAAEEMEPPHGVMPGNKGDKS